MYVLSQHAKAVHLGAKKQIINMMGCIHGEVVILRSFDKQRDAYFFKRFNSMIKQVVMDLGHLRFSQGSLSVVWVRSKNAQTKKALFNSYHASSASNGTSISNQSFFGCAYVNGM